MFMCSGIADPLLGDGRPTSTSTDREMPAAASSVNIITDEHIPDGTTMAVKVPSGKILGYMRGRVPIFQQVYLV